MQLSVIVCAHNPRPAYLRRVIESLQSQTLSKEQWELLLIDNCSLKPLSVSCDLAWHPNARHIREEQLGLTPARLCGIKESASELLIFVDDDNVLAANYLVESLAIQKKWPMLGVWGGQSFGEFETPPPDWTHPYWGMIAVRTVDHDNWSNQMDDNSLPCGAGMCIRRVIGLKYAEILSADTIRMMLDRKGGSLVSGGDTDIAMLACQLGYGTGVFKSLCLNHLIPDIRLTEKYLVCLCEGMNYSQTILREIYGANRPKSTIARKFINLVRANFSMGYKRKFRFATLRGERKARKFLQSNKSLFH